MASWLLLALLPPSSARAACPSYTASSASNTDMCGVEAAPGTNPTVTDWQPIFSFVAQGAWGASGPTRPTLPTGCATPVNEPATFPCELLQAIAMNESSWEQFCVPTTPADQVGKSSRTIISFDCGYGIAQVTSGMHTGETPAFDRALVASDPTYNLATGAQLLAGKWRAVKCVGDRRPDVVEDWYSATWAYNGLAYSNNPSNPNYDANRPVCNPNQGCPNRPYQERVFGWMEYPPTAAHWKSLPVAYPNRGDIPDMPTGIQMVPNLPEPDCAGPTDCVNHRTVHVTACAPAASPSPTPTPTPTPTPSSTPTPTPSTTPSPTSSPVPKPAAGCECNFNHSPPPAAALFFLALFALFRASKKSSHD